MPSSRNSVGKDKCGCLLLGIRIGSLLHPLSLLSSRCNDFDTVSHTCQWCPEHWRSHHSFHFRVEHGAWTFCHHSQAQYMFLPPPCPLVSTDWMKGLMEWLRLLNISFLWRPFTLNMDEKNPVTTRKRQLCYQVVDERKVKRQEKPGPQWHHRAKPLCLSVTNSVNV